MRNSNNSTNELNLIDELNLIQTQIQRMGNNSFMIKGWYITIQLALIVFLFKEVEFGLKWLILIFPFIICSLYDTYFLRLEKIYRKKYEWNIEQVEENDLKKKLELNPIEILSILKDADKKIDCLSLIYLKEIVPYFDKKSEFLLFKVYVLPILVLVIIA